MRLIHSNSEMNTLKDDYRFIHVFTQKPSGKELKGEELEVNHEKEFEKHGFEHTEARVDTFIPKTTTFNNASNSPISSIEGQDTWEIHPVNDDVERSGSQINIGHKQPFWEIMTSESYMKWVLTEGYSLNVEFNSKLKGKHTVSHGPALSLDGTRLLEVGEKIPEGNIYQRLLNMVVKSQKHMPWQTLSHLVTNVILRFAYRNDFDGIRAREPSFIGGCGGGGEKVGANADFGLKDKRAFMEKKSGHLPAAQSSNNPLNKALLDVSRRGGVFNI